MRLPRARARTLKPPKIARKETTRGIGRPMRRPAPSASAPPRAPRPQHVSISIVPVLNPSGRHRTDTQYYAPANAAERPYYDEQECVNRRKNARLVDLNRNFDVQWSDAAGSSGVETDADYRGGAALSEVEAATLDSIAASFIVTQA